MTLIQMYSNTFGEFKFEYISMLKVIFFGSSKHVIPIIEVLKKNFDLALVVTTETPKPSLALPSQTWRSYPVIKHCVGNKIPYLSISNLSDPNLKSLILNLKSPLAVLASFGAIIPSEVLNLFPHGIINVHPSLLPKYRGPTPVQTAILNGDKTTGVTIIKLDEQVDHGPILAQVEEPIFESDTSESLYQRLFRLCSSSIVSTIELYLKGKIKLREQNHAEATFTKRLSRQYGYIDLQKTPKPEIIDRMIRAYYPWPGAWTQWKMSREAGSRSAGENGKWKIVKFLPEKKIQVEGKKPMNYKDFINGYPKIGKEILTKLGINL